MHTIIIIGAGLGGLALAQGLRQAGLSVTVHEKDATPQARNQGCRIRINADGIAGLRAVLPPAAFEVFAATAGNPGPRMDTFDDQLNLVHAHALPVDDALPGGGNLAVNRLTLRRILLAGLGDAVRFGARFTHYTHDSSGTVTAHFADGSAATGDVLVGADGVNSPTRAQRLPSSQVVDAGLRLIYGKVPLAGAEIPEELLGLWTTIVGPGKRFVGLAPVRYRESLPAVAARLAPDIALTPDQDYLACVIGARREHFPASFDGVDLRALELSLVDGWHPTVRRIVESQDPATMFPVSVRTSVPFDAWESSAVTLLGDAVHVMSPAIGVGANTALRDARVLAGRLVEAAGGRAIEDALHAYESEMVAYGFAAVRESAARGHHLVGQDPLPVA